MFVRSNMLLGSLLTQKMGMGELALPATKVRCKRAGRTGAVMQVASQPYALHASALALHPGRRMAAVSGRRRAALLASTAKPAFTGSGRAPDRQCPIAGGQNAARPQGGKAA